jgi:hypothetical protein
VTLASLRNGFGSKRGLRRQRRTSSATVRNLCYFASLKSAGVDRDDTAAHVRTAPKADLPSLALDGFRIATIDNKRPVFSVGGGGRGVPTFAERWSQWSADFARLGNAAGGAVKAGSDRGEVAEIWCAFAAFSTMLLHAEELPRGWLSLFTLSH